MITRDMPTSTDFADHLTGCLRSVGAKLTSFRLEGDSRVARVTVQLPHQADSADRDLILDAIEEYERFHDYAVGIDLAFVWPTAS